MYEITYETETTPITLEIEADDPYSACMMLGRRTQCKKMHVLEIVYRSPPQTIWKVVGLCQTIK